MMKQDQVEERVDQEALLDLDHLLDILTVLKI